MGIGAGIAVGVGVYRQKIKEINISFGVKI